MYSTYLIYCPTLEQSPTSMHCIHFSCKSCTIADVIYDKWAKLHCILMRSAISDVQFVLCAFSYDSVQLNERRNSQHRHAVGLWVLSFWLPNVWKPECCWKLCKWWCVCVSSGLSASMRCLLVYKVLTAIFSHSVESSDLNWKKKKSGGIKIICQSEMRDFSAMAFITDHVNALIEQWFPGETNCKHYSLNKFHWL